MGMYKVHIRSFVYNHSQYIEDAMNGFVMQETDFPFVTTIVDDASTDDTPQIISSYLYRHFDTDDSSVAFREETDYGSVLFARHKVNKNCYFAVVLLKVNHHSQRKNKYPYLIRWTKDVPFVALCEGDDYWTDPLKLQKQANYLEAHPDCMLTVHAADWRTDDRLYPYGCQETAPKDYSVEELILCGGYHFATASFVYRAELNRDWPEWRRKANVGDFPLQILAGLHGTVHYHPDKMCVYRFWNEGSWSFKQQNRETKLAFQKNKITWMTLLDEATEHKYQTAIYTHLFQHYHSLFYLNELSFFEYAKAVQKSGQIRYGRLMKDFIRVRLSPVYSFLCRIKVK